MRTLAHLSDLHFGRGPNEERAAERLVDSLLDGGIDHVVVTGDVTHRGCDDELDTYEEVFATLTDEKRVTVIPGNHDRTGDDAARRMMGDERVRVVRRPGLHIVCVDSTGPHNRTVFRGHGELSSADLGQIDAALDGAAAGALCVVALHHHVLPLPEEDLGERLSSFLGLPFAAELSTGTPLLECLRGRCDLVLHGHRHVPSAQELAHPCRPLRIYNAGSSTQLLRTRVFAHAGGALVGEPSWLHAEPDVNFVRAVGSAVLAAP